MELSFEDQAGTCQARFSFLEFGDVEGRYVEAAGFHTSAGARERRGKNNSIADGQGVRGVWFGGIDVDPLVAGEGRRVEPGTIGKKSVATKARYGGLEVQAAGDRHSDNLVVVLRENCG